MTAMTFDTLKFVETLKESGFDEKQARGMSAAIQEVQKANLEGLATKADIQDVKRDLKELESSMDAKLAALELRIIKWVIASSGIVVALIKLLPGGH